MSNKDSGNQLVEASSSTARPNWITFLINRKTETGAKDMQLSVQNH